MTVAQDFDVRRQRRPSIVGVDPVEEGPVAGLVRSGRQAVEPLQLGAGDDLARSQVAFPAAFQPPHGTGEFGCALPDPCFQGGPGLLGCPECGAFSAAAAVSRSTVNAADQVNARRVSICWSRPIAAPTETSSMPGAAIVIPNRHAHHTSSGNGRISAGT
ncbi:hypothetical protein [Amycolatopsis tolypomycina]|uniref:hypothetical protein n=1 Tax=Amycolatopsis tolypomycina TaxID=208445 RepID=UPI000B80EEBB|nr:hypothetical protein [Amycolatopsis tolypomycina]